MTEEFSEGQLVEHKRWGRGKVVVVRPPYVEVHFPALALDPGGARRTLQLATGFLSLASDQADPAFDGIKTGAQITRRRPSTSKPKKTLTTTLDDAVTWFRTTYPGLFEDPQLVADEIQSRRQGQLLWASLLGEGRARALLDAGQPADIADRLGQVYAATSIPSRFEVMAVRKGLEDAHAAVRLLQAVVAYVDHPGPETFTQLAEAVGSLPAPAEGSRVLNWPNVTLVPFLADPSRFIVLKPEATKTIAARMNVELPYTTTPVWPCYEGFERIAAALLETLQPLGARDYIDVQTFMWVTRKLE